MHHGWCVILSRKRSPRLQEESSVDCRVHPRCIERVYRMIPKHDHSAPPPSFVQIPNPTPKLTGKRRARNDLWASSRSALQILRKGKETVGKTDGSSDLTNFNFNSSYTSQYLRQPRKIFQQKSVVRNTGRTSLISPSVSPDVSVSFFSSFPNPLSPLPRVKLACLWFLVLPLHELFTKPLHHHLLQAHHPSKPLPLGLRNQHHGDLYARP